MSNRYRARHVMRYLFVGSLLTSFLASGCTVETDETRKSDDGSSSSSVTSALSDTTPDNLEDGLKYLTDLGQKAAGIYSKFSTVLQAYQLFEQLNGAKSFETRITETLEAIRSDIKDVAAKVAEGQQAVSAQLAAAQIARAATASELARNFVLQNNAAVFDPNTNPAAAIAFADSRTVALTFMDNAWYSKVSTAANTPRQFEWRLGLPHLISAITLRLNVLAAVDRNFVTSGTYSSELLEYYSAIDRRLVQAEAALIICWSGSVPDIRPGNDLNLPIRFCRNSQTGVQLGVGTIANPLPDAPVRAELLNGMGFDRIRAFRDGLYALANRLPKNSTLCAQEYQTCSSSGTKTARYGADASYFGRTVRGGFSCGNETFGDPIVGPTKSCSTGDLIYSPCANERADCYFFGVKAVRFGVNGAYVNKLALSGILCGTSEFGDPAKGKTKACDYADPVWTSCASEGGRCSLSGNHFIRYGYGDQFVYWKSQGSFDCNNAHGDPWVGKNKLCEVASLP
jgi:hypothetical protein